ncbi:MAG: virulence RhuM family protein [Burkholderiales bacterium]|nr:virulence RhuM family protein [Burkholderiales bacterium]
MNKELILFNLIDGNISIDVTLENDTLWLSQKQMAEIFGKDVDTIGLHLKNIYQENELNEGATTEFFSVVQIEGKRSVVRKIKYYSLDAIISVGYRVNSKRGTQFRIWANQVLKDYILKGYAINQNIINATTVEFQQAISLLKHTLINNQLVSETGQTVINIIHTYAKTWRNLLQYDEDRLTLPKSVHKISHILEYNIAKKSIDQLKIQLLNIGEATQLFGNERNENLTSILNNLEQTMFGDELYKSVEEKSANLLYMIIKDHPFSDGNKRIGSFLFLLYLQLNKLDIKFDNNGLTALALLIAESNPKQKDLMVRLIINLLVG